MNNRIIELKKLATHQAIWPGDPDAGELDAEKFAELIIKECVDACEKNSWMGLNAFQRAGQIKNHFGVE